MTVAKAEEGHVCPGCHAATIEKVYSVSNIPVQSCVLLDTKQEALDYPCRDLELGYCSSCGLVHNMIFDEAIIDYTSKTEESQHFSGTFSRFAKQLAQEIADKCQLEGKSVLEIGCGKGDFLAEFCSLKPCTGTGIDPGYYEDKNRVDQQKQDLDFIIDYFGPEYYHLDPDIILCRHTLEHVGQPAKFVSDIRKCIGDRKDVSVFFETPDAERVFSEGAFWDIYYEHCNYFTTGTHVRLFRQEGFEVTEVGLMYDNQYIYQYAGPAASQLGNPKAALGEDKDLEDIRRHIDAFPEKIKQIRDKWKNFVLEKHAEGKRIAIWGGGSKCVAFLTTLGLSEEISWIIDINPFKAGKFVPGTGHQVVSPDSLAEDKSPPDIVIVMNPVYVNEITEQLKTLNIHPEILAL